MPYVAIVTLELNGTTYTNGQEIDSGDLPSTKIRSMVDKGLIDFVSAGGGGDVSGPVSSTDGYVALWSGVGGDTLQDSTVDPAWFDQDVSSGSSPTFTGTNFTGVPVAGLATGTDGELITWDAAGAPATVPVGTATHVLTSNGAGAAPSFQAAGGATQLNDLSDASDTGTRNLFLGAVIPAGASGATDTLALSNAGNALGVLTSGDGNVALGSNCLAAVATGGHNVALGNTAGYVTTGSANVFVGRNSGFGATSGSYNLFLGDQAGGTTTTASHQTQVGALTKQGTATARDGIVVVGYNIAAGDEVGAIAIGSSDATGNVLRVESGVLTVGGSTVGGATDIDGLSDASLAAADNLYLGGTVPVGVTAATRNIAISSAGTAADAITSATDSIAIGDGALGSTVAAVGNIAIGIDALSAGLSSSDDYNVAVGFHALKGAIKDSNTALGSYAADAVSSGKYNVAVGKDSLGTTTTGYNNVGVGFTAGASAVGANNTVSVGSYAHGTGENSIAIGYSTSASGAGGVAIGVSAAGASATAGADEIVLGVAAHTVKIPGNLEVTGTGAGATDINGLSDAYYGGSYNLGLGVDTLDASTTSAYNTAVGGTALASLGSGNGQNSAFGYKAGNAATGAYGTFLGGRAGESVTTGDSNVMVGFECGEQPGGVDANQTTTASRQVLVGFKAGQSATTQRDDIIAIGYNVTAGNEAGAIAIGSTNATGNIIRVESGVLTVGGNPVIKPVTAQTATANIAVTDHVVTGSHATVAFTLTLPTLASAGTGREFVVKNLNAAVVTVDGNGAETIDGSADVALNQYESVTLVCNGTEWMIL